MAREQDKYANVAAIRVTQSAANVETYGQILTGISLGEGRGMLIDSVSFKPTPATLALLAAANDWLTMAITTRNDLTDLNDITQAAILTALNISVLDLGVAASGIHSHVPLVQQFFPPMIVAAPRIFAAVDSSALASAGLADFRIHFRYVKLSPQEYIELAEAFVLS